MDLEAFIATTLKETLKGIKAAQADTDIGSCIAPRILNAKRPDAWTFGVDQTTHAAITEMQFDVSVTVERGAGGTAGGKIKIATLEMGADGNATLKNANVSRVRFSVPVMMPEAPQAHFSSPLAVV